MNTFIRWGRFNLVGAMGMAVQLGALAVLERWAAGHYLYASAAALEITLLHNFVWHVHYTWKDRRDSLRAADPIDAISSFEWPGFHGGKSCADANTGGRGAHAAARRELYCDSLLLNYYLHPRR